MNSDAKKTAHIERISLFAEKGAAGLAVQEARCVAGQGLEGDFHFGGDGSISLMGVETQRAIAQMTDGLCTAKFAANILTQGMDYAAWAPNDRFRAGPVLFQLARVGKRCFDECRHFAAHGPCALARGCAFARPLSSGALHPGDEIVREE